MNFYLNLNLNLFFFFFFFEKKLRLNVFLSFFFSKKNALLIIFSQQNATGMAQRFVTQWGFNEKVGFVFYEDPSKAPNEAKEAIKELLDERYRFALNVLKKHETQLHRVAAALLEREELSGEEIQRLW